MFDSVKNVITSFSNTFVDRNEPAAEQSTSDRLQETVKPQESGVEPQETLSEKLNVAKQWSTYFAKKILENGEVTSKKIAAKVQSVTKMNTILPEVMQKIPYWREFNETQEAFAVEQSKNITMQMSGNTAFSVADDLLPPWHPDVSGLNNPAAVMSLKAKILALSDHEKTFLVAPPKAAQLTDYSETADNAPEAGTNRAVGPLRSPAALQLACSLLQVDSKLASMRYRLVPSRTSEAEFWRNYLYRVSVLQQSAQLSAMAGDSAPSDSGDSGDFVCVDKVLEPSATSDRPALAEKDKRPAGTGSTRTKAKSNKGHLTSSATAKRSATSAARASATSTRNTDQGLTVDEQLEAELAREVDELLLQKDRSESGKSTASPGTSADDELDAQLELELSELSKAEDKSK